MQKQVDKSHYKFTSYMSKGRWTSTWHQLDEVLKFQPQTVLEIGPGPGTFKQVGKLFDLNVKTLDLDPELRPDIVGSATQIPMSDASVDVACAFQVLEHMPFENGKNALKEMFRVASRGVIISLPNVSPCWANTLAIPYMRRLQFIAPNLFARANPHVFDGEHYWEIGKKGFGAKSVANELFSLAPSGTSLKSFRVHEFTYHHFFVFTLPVK